MSKFEEWYKRYKCECPSPDSHGCHDCKNTGFLFDAEVSELILDQQKIIDQKDAEIEKLRKCLSDMLDKDQFPQDGYHVEMFIWKAKKTLEELK